MTCEMVGQSNETAGYNTVQNPCSNLDAKCFLVRFHRPHKEVLVTQLVESYTFNVEVSGSSPDGDTKLFL